MNATKKKQRLTNQQAYDARWKARIDRSPILPQNRPVDHLPPAAFADVMSDAFLDSYAWKRLRMVALRYYGPKCMCCGMTPDKGGIVNVDHIKPRKIFPQLALELSNVQVLCHDCNHGKGNWDMTDWRPPRHKLGRPT